jgi:cobalt-zinc-cadmium efflux system protein
MVSQLQVCDTRRDRIRLRWCAGLTGCILVVEAVGGYLAGSLALLSDSGHMMTDLLAILLSLFAISFAMKPPTDRKTYGYYRMEILAALFNGTVLVLLSLYLFYESAHRLVKPRPVATGLMLAVAGVGLMANLAGIILLSPARRSLNIRGALLHVMGDAFSSVGVLTGGVVMQLTGWYRADPLISLLIGVVILWGALRLIKEALDILLEATPPGIELSKIDRAIASVEGVVGIHDLHVWSITSGMPALSGHVVVRDSALGDTDRMLNHIKRVLEERFGICHTTLQVESERYEEVGVIHEPETGGD